MTEQAFIRTGRLMALGSYPEWAQEMIEGATGEWSSLVCASDADEQAFAPESRKTAMRWLRMHAHYDDMLPLEALEIVCSLIGTDAK